MPMQNVDGSLKKAAIKFLAPSALALVLLTGAAFAQGRGSGENTNTATEKQQETARRALEAQQKQKEIDAQYKAALDRTKPAATAPVDPWAKVR
jgi:hypothetical protein